MPDSEAVPLRYQQLKDFHEVTYVRVDVRHGHNLPKDERYIEVVPVDGSNGPMKMLAEGLFRAPRHEFRRNQNTGWARNSLARKDNGIGDPFCKRWLSMSSTEKEIWLHVIARSNWWRRGQLPSGHPEYRDRSFAGGPPPDVVEELEQKDEAEHEEAERKEVVAVPQQRQIRQAEPEGPSMRQLRLMCGQPRSYLGSK